MRKFLLSVSFLFAVVLQVAGQAAPPSNLSGDDLKVWLRQNWYDGKRVVLDYSTARGKMYNYVDNYNNTVTCVYSGYQESLPYSESSTSTSVGIINCEHSVPQSWFNEAERMRTDIHHLFPTHTTWNSDRGSDPFAEIPDNQTIKWMRGASSQSTIPISNIEEYSEDTYTQFEPREDHKGNLARAIFYFYTMHAGQSFDAGKGVISAVADPNTLYQWHLQDPVDDRERERNNRVEVAQGNRNPYIDYPELVAKAWGFTPANCTPTTQVTDLTVAQAATTSITLNWASGSGDRRLIVVRQGSAVDFTPTGSYSGINADYTLAADQGNGHRVVYNGSNSSVTVSGLTGNTTYYVQAFEFCSTDNTYNTTNAPTLTANTQDYTCSGVPTAASDVSASGIKQTELSLSWTNGSGDGRIVVLRKGEAVAFVPQVGSTYNGAAADFATAATLTDGSKLIYNGAGDHVVVTGLEAGTTYYAQVFESCSNGYQYAATTAPTLAVTTEAAASPISNGTLLAVQDFNGTATDGWAVTSGFSSSTDNNGYPGGQRLLSGASFQVAAAEKVLELSEQNIAGKQDVYLQLHNSVISTTTGNGIEASDYFEVYVALDGAAYAPVPDIKITGDASDNNVRYGMNGTATVITNAGTALSKTFVKADGEAGEFETGKAPSILQVAIPNGTTTVKAKLVIKTSGDKEVWCVDDVALYSTATTTAVAEDAYKAGIVIAPNPTAGNVMLYTQRPLDQVQVTVLNSLGGIVYKQQLNTLTERQELNLSHLPAGLYLVHLKAAKLQAVQRLVITK